MKTVIYKYPDGGVRFERFSNAEVGNDVVNARAESEMLNLHPITEESCLSYRVVDSSQLPQDKTFRDAWTDDNPTDTVDIDMPKARDIQMARIRALRNAKLEELDKEQNMLVSKGGDTAALFAQKQVLRDLPANTDLSGITDPETLANTIPTEVQ